MSPTLVAFIFSVGASGWVYSKFARRSGEGNLTPAIIGSAIVGGILFLVTYTLFNAFL